jgi:hypothetical protein
MHWTVSLNPLLEIRVRDVRQAVQHPAETNPSLDGDYRNGGDGYASCGCDRCNGCRSLWKCGVIVVGIGQTVHDPVSAAPNCE